MSEQDIVQSMLNITRPNPIPGASSFREPLASPFPEEEVVEPPVEEATLESVPESTPEVEEKVEESLPDAPMLDDVGEVVTTHIEQEPEVTPVTEVPTPNVDEVVAAHEAGHAEAQDTDKVTDTIQILDAVAAKMSAVPPRHVTAGRIEIGETKLRKRISNRAITTVINNYRRNKCFLDKLAIQGTTLRKGGAGIWEEGGSDENLGSVLIVTDADGNKIAPIVVSHNKDEFNGKHALLPVKEGDYILLGGRKDVDFFVAAYKVDSINSTAEKNGETYPQLNCTMDSVTCFDCRAELLREEDGGVKAAHLDIQVDGGRVHTVFFDNQAAYYAAVNRTFEIDADTPAYVKDYVDNFFPSSDYRNWCQDAEALAQYTEEESVDAVYAKADKILGEDALAAGKDERAILIIVFDAQGDKLYAYFLGGVFNMKTDSSEGKRHMYCRVEIKEGADFYYPDTVKSRDTILTYDVVKDAIARSSSCRAIAFRRMTGPTAQLITPFLI